jgi:predicted DNA-binding protein
MKKTMIYLPEETHEGLRKLAFEAKTSIAALIRRAVDVVYGEDIEDIRDMEEELAKYRLEPGYGMKFEEFWRQEMARRQRKPVSAETVKVHDKEKEAAQYQAQSDSTMKSEG